MAESYTRQSTFADGDVISADHGNREFNQLVKAFNEVAGHNHDGTAAGGAAITDLADRDRTHSLKIRKEGISGTVVDVDPLLTSDSDLKLASQKAIKTYIDSAASKAHVDSKAYTDQSIADVIIDEDDMVSDLDTKVPSQQSVKAYTDQAKLDAVAQADLNRANNLIDEDSMATNSATRPASQQSIVAYVNSKFSDPTGTAVNADKLGNQLPSYYENIPERLGYTPIQQGGGNGQGTNKIYIGWGSSNAIRLQVDGTDFGSTWPITSRDTQLLEGVSKATIVADAKANTVSTIAGVENRINVTPGQKITSANELHAAFSVYQPTPGSDAFVGFHVDGDYAAYFGIDGTTDKFVVGGWSMGSVKYALYHEGNKPTATELNVVSQTEVSESSAVNTVVKRDSVGDIKCRSLRSEYADQSGISGAMAFRVNHGVDNYLRFCDDKSAIRNFLRIEESSANLNPNSNANIDDFVEPGNFRVLNPSGGKPNGYPSDCDFFLEVKRLDGQRLVQILRDARTYREYTRRKINNPWGEWLASGPVFKRVGAAGFNAPDGFNNYEITTYNTTSTTQVLPPNPVVGDTVVIKKVRNTGMLTITASRNMYEDTNWHGGLSHNVTKACILSFIFDGTNWVLTVK